MKIRTLILLLVVVLTPYLAMAQGFDKNKVVWEKVDHHFYQSVHFDIYFDSLDLNDQTQKAHFEEIVSHFENSYDWLSNNLEYRIEKRIPVIIYRTHSLFEATNIIDASGLCRTYPGYLLFGRVKVSKNRVIFLPEGVGAFAESTRNRIVIKIDFLPPLNRTIITHELAHIFQFDMMKINLVRRVIYQEPLPIWFIEGGADFLANWFSPYTRDDIRKMQQRGVAANPEKNLSTLEQLNRGGGNPYSIGAMFLEFLKDTFGKEPTLKFINDGLRGTKLKSALKTLSRGKINSNEKFDQMNRDYWKKVYSKDMLDRPKPYDDTENFSGRNIAPGVWPYPTVSGDISPDGKQIVCFSVQKNGITLVSIPVIRELPYEEKKNDDDKDKNTKEEKPRNLTPWFPPKYYEEPIVQELNVWPFNGSDLKVSRDGKLVAFFARKNRDHALFIYDLEKRDIVKAIELPLDQAFSPAFSPDAKIVYFSAAKNITRDIYSINLETEEIKNITQEKDPLGFDTAPAISPDGTKLAFVAFTGDFQKLFLLDLLTGERRQLTFNRFNDNSPSFSDDGQTLIYTSDEKDRIWNVYTLDLQTNTVSQWTDFFGGAFTPKFARDRKDLVYTTVYWQYDQYRSYIYANFKTYELALKKPMRTYVVEDRKESTRWSFRTENLFKVKLDDNQISNPQKPPKKLKFRVEMSYFGYDNYWGVFSQSRFHASDILENHIYSARFVQYGNILRLLDFAYFNQKNRWNWGYAAYDWKLPLRYMYYDPVKGNPKQPVLNNANTHEFGLDLFTKYPLDKFQRFEFVFKARQRRFEFNSLDQELVNTLNDSNLISPKDVQVFNFFNHSSGNSLVFASAYVLDTVYYSYNAQGPVRGNALRAQVDLALPVPGFLPYASFNIDARKYFQLSQRGGNVFAVRGAALQSNRANGDFVLMGGPDTLRGYDYGSIMGNQIYYASAELRFPLVDAVVFPAGIGIGPFRGLLFADVGTAKFSNQLKLSDQHGISYGIGLQFLPFNFVWSKRQIDNYQSWKYSFYFNFNW